MSRACFEVVPVDDGWVIRTPGNGMFELRPSKSEAVRRARQLGRHYDAWRIRVLSSSGEVETELSSTDTLPAS